MGEKLEIINDLSNLDGKIHSVAISDVHITDQNCQPAVDLLDFFEQLQKHSVQNILLLGDVFDFLFGPSKYFERKFAWFYAELLKFKESGSNLYFLEGNHEFALDKIKWPEVTFPHIKDHYFHVPNSDLVVAHGDLFDAPKAYLKFRAFVKWGVLHKICSYFPGIIFDGYAKVHSGLSRGQDVYRDLDTETILEAAEEGMIKAGFKDKHLIFGHFHHEMNEPQKKNPNYQMFCCESWDSPSALIYTESKKFIRYKMDQA